MQDDLIADRAAAAGDFATALRHLRQAAAASPPSLERALKMTAMARATGDVDAAFRHVHEALAIDPLDVSALLVKATILHNSHTADAGEFYGRALAQAPSPVPPHLTTALGVARQRYSAWQQDARRDLTAVASAAAPMTPSLQAFIDASLHLIESERSGPTHYCYPGLATAGFHARNDFPWIAELEAMTPVIQQELDTILRRSAGRPYIRYPDHVPVDQWRALNDNADWSAVHLIERGTVNPLALSYCPQTLALLKNLSQPHIDGIGPNAMFSLLAPHTHIPPHTGITNTRLICHLPLVTPPGCWFRVGDETRSWEQGEAWIFDDTIEHEAMNPTDTLRAVLIFDVWHPDLDAHARDGVAAVMQSGGALHAL